MKNKELVNGNSIFLRKRSIPMSSMSSFSLPKKEIIQDSIPMSSMSSMSSFSPWVEPLKYKKGDLVLMNGRNVLEVFEGMANGLPIEGS